jgi:valyl-tRNA synthetase
MPEIPKAYEPQEIEERWAKAWFDEKLFRAENSADGEPFSIALPPPNITGSIHIGHMLEHTQIDILVRWQRMRGRRTLWLPGMDHAGIATQYVVERKLAEQGIKRQEIGREEFERRVWKWKAESGGQIKQQMIRLGASCDWTREWFTLDPPLYRAVIEAFLRLYREGLIYRGRYMVNWCPDCQTAISDLEVVHTERPGKLWHLRYPMAGSPGQFLVVATTRPETMLGDTAVAVHPDDERYQKLIGKAVILPLMNREIPVIADTYVDREFGTGVVKITPAHDPNDFEMGKRHGLDEIDVMTNDGHINGNGGKYAGLARFAARKRIVEDLTALGLLEKIEDITHSVGICDRSKTEVEPKISTQWFCKMKPLAEPAKKAVIDELIEVVPDNQRTILLNWLDNIRDWCISRQLWWGHRIPVWHCGDCEEMIPATDSSVELFGGHARAAGVPKKCPKCGGAKLAQETDVLDTWFSSGLWPFSTLGWPDETADLRTFYPTTLLISGYDILFFWDARMIMMGMHLSGARFGSVGGPKAAAADTIPFRRLYLHSLVRTAEGAKMSKTKGTGVDPLALTQQFGTDALRYMLASMAAPGTDIALSEDRILGARAFANKIWNAARFLFLNLAKRDASGFTLEDLAGVDIRKKAPYRLPTPSAALPHRWIFSRLSGVTAQVNDALDNFRFHEAAQAIYQFFWGDFCDWYIEGVKGQLADADPVVAVAAWCNIFAVLDAALRLLHPVMPFLTEELWHRIPQPKNARSIALDRFPEVRPEWIDTEAEAEMAAVQELSLRTRNLRSEAKIPPKARLDTLVVTEHPFYVKVTDQYAPNVAAYTSSANVVRTTSHDPAKGAISRTPHFNVQVPTESSLDPHVELPRLKKKIAELEADVESKRLKLSDEAFRSKAPEKVVQAMEATLREREIELGKLRERLKQLE